MTRFNVLPWWRSIDNLCLTLILQVDCCVWPPAQYINFHFIPARFRSIYVSSITLCWNTFLSYMKHRVHTFSLNIENAPPSSLKKILDNLCDYANEFASFAGYDSRVKLYKQTCRLLHSLWGKLWIDQCCWRDLYSKYSVMS